MIALAFVVGLAAGIWFGIKGGQSSSAASPEGPKPNLNHLAENVAIRFYACLGSNTVPVEVSDFASRIDQLLVQYETVSNGKIKVSRFTSADQAARSASADGLKPFNLEKGDACYLGLAISCKGQKELLTPLSPEWEPALEWDLARAIRRVSETPKSAAAATIAATPAASVEELKRAIPDLTAVSVQEGRRALQEETLKQLKSSVSESEAQLKAALERLTQAQNGGSEAEQQARMKEVQALQQTQAEKYKQLAAQLQSQMAAFEQFKSSNK